MCVSELKKRAMLRWRAGGDSINNLQSGTSDAVRAGGVHVISRPVECLRCSNRAMSLKENSSPRTITSSIWRRILVAIAPTILAELHTLNQRLSVGTKSELANSCRKTPSLSGLEVYRKSTGGLVLGKYAGKDPTVQAVQVGLVLVMRGESAESAWVEEQPDWLGEPAREQVPQVASRVVQPCNDPFRSGFRQS